MKFVIIHGIHTHGKGIDQLGALLEKAGHDVTYFEYPKRWALTLYRKSVRHADGRALMHTVPDGTHVIAHSYGALVLLSSIQAGAIWGNCFIFGGACTSDKYTYPPDAFTSAYMIYNPADLALRLGALLPFHPFGRLGQRGYAGYVRDRRIQNVPALENDLGINHSHYFRAGMREYWCKFILDRL